MCGCEKGFTEVMTSNGFLDYCTKTPGSDYKKVNVKRSRGRLRHMHKQNESRTWTLQPLGPGGKSHIYLPILPQWFSFIVQHCIFLHFPCSKHITQDYRLETNNLCYCRENNPGIENQWALDLENQLSLFKA